MRYRKFGSTGLEISELVFGGGFVGGLLLHADDVVKREAIRRALDGGINWIDTAPSYGDGASEEALGWLLKESASTPYVSTKVRIDLAGLNDIAGQVEESIQASLQRLQRDSVALLQLHNPIQPSRGNGALGVDDVLGAGGVADALESMRDQGLTRHIGLTALGDATSVCSVLGSGRFESAQVYYNLLNPSAANSMPAAWRGHSFAGVMSACRDGAVAVMAIRVFAAGVLATNVRHGREIVVTEHSDVAIEEARAQAVFSELGIDEGDKTPYGTRSQTALRFVLANPDVSGAVFGLAELEHLEQVLAAAEMEPLDAGALARLEKVYAGNFGRTDPT